MLSQLLSRMACQKHDSEWKWEDNLGETCVSPRVVIQALAQAVLPREDIRGFFSAFQGGQSQSFPYSWREGFGF